MAADNAVLEAVNCNLCGNADEKLLFIKDGLRIVKCNSCGLMFVNPRPKKEYLQKLYSEGYYRISKNDSIGYREDRKSTRLNSSHGYISSAGLCLKNQGAGSRARPPAPAHPAPADRTPGSATR